MNCRNERDGGKAGGGGGRTCSSILAPREGSLPWAVAAAVGRGSGWASRAASSFSFFSAAASVFLMLRSSLVSSNEWACSVPSSNFWAWASRISCSCVFWWVSASTEPLPWLVVAGAGAL